MIWSATYTGPGGSPGYTAAEPLSDPRMFLLWNALEGIQRHALRAGDDLVHAGEPARLEPRRRAASTCSSTPAPTGRSPSARLEQIRDGIEDWDVLDAVRRKRGPAAVRDDPRERRTVQRDRRHG